MRSSYSPETQKAVDALAEEADELGWAYSRLRTRCLVLLTYIKGINHVTNAAWMRDDELLNHGFGKSSLALLRQYVPFKPWSPD